MARRKVATTVYLESAQDQRLKVLAERTGRSVAAYIREGVDLVLAAHAEELPEQLGLFDPSQLTLFEGTPAGALPVRARTRPGPKSEPGAAGPRPAAPPGSEAPPREK